MTAHCKSTEVTAKSINAQNVLLSTPLDTASEKSIVDGNFCHTYLKILFKYHRKGYLR